MKIYNLVIGIIFTLLGIGCFAAMIITDTVFEMTLLRWSGYCFVFGVLTVGRFVYRNSPGRREIYAALEEYEDRENNDELNRHIKDRASGYAYNLGLIAICLSVIAFDILGTLGIVENAGMIILYLCVLLAVQIIAKILFMRYFKSRYN